MKTVKVIISFLMSFPAVQRFFSKTPAFFQYVQSIGGVCAAIGAYFVKYPDTLPQQYNAVGGYLIAVGAIAAFVSQFAIQNNVYPNILLGNKNLR